MKKRFTEGLLAFALRQAASGTPVSEITRRWLHGNNPNTYAEIGSSFGWRVKII